MRLLVLLLLLFTVGCTTPVLTADDAIETNFNTYTPFGLFELKERTGGVYTPTEVKPPLSYGELTKLVQSVHKRFTYVSDLKQYGTAEWWISMAEVPRHRFKGDCEDFAQAIRKELKSRGQMSFLAMVSVSSDIPNHIVAVYNGWIIDNIHKYPMPRSKLNGYKFFSISEDNIYKPWRVIQ